MKSAGPSISDSLSLAFQATRKKNILQNILLFCRILKKLKIHVTMGGMLDAVKSLQYINFSNKDELYYALRANLLSRYEEISVFDRVFQTFWMPYEEMQEIEDGDEFRQEFEAFVKKECSVDEWADDNLDDRELETLKKKSIPEYSPVENLVSKDFSEFSDKEIDQITAMILDIVNKIATKMSRRKHPNPKDKVICLRRTLRENMKYGGEILDWVRLNRKTAKHNLITFADVSGSMDCYSNFFVQFIYCLQTRVKGVESFVFSTQLTRITDLLKNTGLHEALKKISKIALHWSGGTNIGKCLEKFNHDYGPSIVNTNSVVMIISDGWDRGDTELLEKEMIKLKQNCYKIIWLNPLLSNPSYEPICKGMQAILPHLSYFMPFYNLNCMLALGRKLSAIR